MDNGRKCTFLCQKCTFYQLSDDKSTFEKKCIKKKDKTNFTKTDKCDSFITKESLIYF